MKHEKKNKTVLETCQCDLLHQCLSLIKNQNTGEKAGKGPGNVWAKIIHTPTKNAEFKDVFSDVSIKHFDKGQVHMECFQAHPCEWNQEKIMQKYSTGYEASYVIQNPIPRVQEEHQVQQELGAAHSWMRILEG